MAEEGKKKERNELHNLEHLASKYKIEDIDVYKQRRDKAFETLATKSNALEEVYRKTRNEALYNRDMAMKFLEERSRNSRFLNLGRELASIQNAYLSTMNKAEEQYNLGMLGVKHDRKTAIEQYDLADTMWKYQKGAIGKKSRRDYLVENKDKLGDKFAELYSLEHQKEMQRLVNEVLKQTDNFDNKDIWNDKIDKLAETHKIGRDVAENLKSNWEVYQKTNYVETPMTSSQKQYIANIEQFDENSGYYRSRNGLTYLGETKDTITKGELYKELEDTLKNANLSDGKVFGYKDQFYISKVKDGNRIFKRLKIANYVSSLKYDTTYKIEDINDTKDGGMWTASGLFNIGGVEYKTKKAFFSDVKSGNAAGKTPYKSNNEYYRAIYDGFRNNDENYDRAKELLKAEIKYKDPATKKRWKKAINSGKLDSFVLQQYIQASRNGHLNNTVSASTHLIGKAHGKYWTIMDGKLYELERK